MCWVGSSFFCFCKAFSLTFFYSISFSDWESLAAFSSDIAKPTFFFFGLSDFLGLDHLEKLNCEDVYKD
jgi:hypothetical protein